jgi:hypothetical protein
MDGLLEVLGDVVNMVVFSNRLTNGDKMRPSHRELVRVNESSQSSPLSTLLSLGFVEFSGWLYHFRGNSNVIASRTQ